MSDYKQRKNTFEFEKNYDSIFKKKKKSNTNKKKKEIKKNG